MLETNPLLIDLLEKHNLLGQGREIGPLTTWTSHCYELPTTEEAELAAAGIPFKKEKVTNKKHPEYGKEFLQINGADTPNLEMIESTLRQGLTATCPFFGTFTRSNSPGHVIFSPFLAPPLKEQQPKKLHQTEIKTYILSAMRHARTPQYVQKYKWTYVIPQNNFFTEQEFLSQREAENFLQEFLQATAKIAAQANYVAPYKQSHFTLHSNYDWVYINPPTGLTIEHQKL
jgi:hypothetical protein